MTDIRNEGRAPARSAAGTGLSSLRDGAATRLHPDGLQSHGAGELLAGWQLRDEAYGRMIAATQAGDDAAYRQARTDFRRAK